MSDKFGMITQYQNFVNARFLEVNSCAQLQIVLYRSFISSVVDYNRPTMSSGFVGIGCG